MNYAKKIWKREDSVPGWDKDTVRWYSYSDMTPAEADKAFFLLGTWEARIAASSAVQPDNLGELRVYDSPVDVEDGGVVNVGGGGATTPTTPANYDDDEIVGFVTT